MATEAEKIASMEEEVKRLAAEINALQKELKAPRSLEDWSVALGDSDHVAPEFQHRRQLQRRREAALLRLGEELKMKQAVQKAVEMGVVDVVELRCAGNAAPNETRNDLRRTMLCWTVLSY
jgi:hypothetical protein